MHTSNRGTLKRPSRLMTVSSNAKILSRQQRHPVPGRNPVFQSNESNGLNRVSKKKRPAPSPPPPPAPSETVPRKPLVIGVGDRSWRCSAQW